MVERDEKEDVMVDVHARLVRLERQSVRLRRVVVMLGCLAVCPLLMGQSELKEQVLRAERLIIDPWGFMGAKPGGMIGVDANGRLRLDLKKGEAGLKSSFDDEDGSMLTLHDQEGRARLEIAVDKAGKPQITAYDAFGRSVGEWPAGSSVKIVEPPLKDAPREGDK